MATFYIQQQDRSSCHVNTVLNYATHDTHRVADKSLARPTSRCILFDGENISFDASPVIQGVSRLVDITAGGDFLGFVIKKVHINMCPILDGYGVMTA